MAGTFRRTPSTKPYVDGAIGKTGKGGLMPSISGLWTRLREKRYREEFVATITRRMIPLQISTIMRARHINQKQLAEASGLTQGAISRAANPNYGNLTINTIIRVAAGLDVAFIGVFVPFSRLETFFRDLSEQRLADVATFTEEDEALTDGGIPSAISIDTNRRVQLLDLPKPRQLDIQPANSTTANSNSVTALRLAGVVNG